MRARRELFPGQIASAIVVEGFLVIGILALLALVRVTRAFQHTTT